MQQKIILLGLGSKTSWLGLGSETGQMQTIKTWLGFSNETSWLGLDKTITLGFSN